MAGVIFGVYFTVVSLERSRGDLSEDCFSDISNANLVNGYYNEFPIKRSPMFVKHFDQ